MRKGNRKDCNFKKVCSMRSIFKSFLLFNSLVSDVHKRSHLDKSAASVCTRHRGATHWANPKITLFHLKWKEPKQQEISSRLTSERHFHQTSALLVRVFFMRVFISAYLSRHSAIPKISLGLLFEYHLQHSIDFKNSKKLISKTALATSCLFCYNLYLEQKSLYWKKKYQF